MASKGRPRDPLKMQQVVETATRQFLQQGYERTSMESVAQESEVSKMTIYNYFPNKEALFEACVTSHTEQVFSASVSSDVDPTQPEQALTLIAKRFLALIRSEDVLRLFRTIYGMANHHPETCACVYHAGPAHIHQTVSQYLEKANAAGSLKIENSVRAADQFLALFLGRDHITATLGMGIPNKADDEQTIKENLAFFLTYYRAK